MSRIIREKTRRDERFGGFDSTTRIRYTNYKVGFYSNLRTLAISSNIV